MTTTPAYHRIELGRNRSLLRIVACVLTIAWSVAISAGFDQNSIQQANEAMIRAGVNPDAFGNPNVVNKTLPASNSTTYPPSNDRYLLDLADPAKNFQVSIPTNGRLHFTFIRSFATNASVTVRLQARFHGEQSGQELELRPSPMNLTFEAGEVVAAVQFQVTLPRSREKFVGTLVLSGPDTPPLLWRGSLLRGEVNVSGPATLVVDQPRLTYHVPSALWSGTPRPEVIATLHDKDRTWPVEGLHLSPGMITMPEHSRFSFERNLVFFLNGVRADGLTQHPPDGALSAARAIPAGGQAVLGIGFTEFGLGRPAVGDYTVEINVRAASSMVSDKDQKITLNFKVSHPWWPAAACLLLALLVSFITNKGVRRQRQHLEVRQRLAAADADWLAAEDPTYSVVWARALLGQAGQLARSFWQSPVAAAELMDQVEPVLKTLREAARARAALAGKHALIIARFRAVIRDKVRSLYEDQMSAAAAEKASADLATLRSQLAGHTYQGAYWKELQQAVSGFLAMHEPGSLPGITKAESDDWAALAQTQNPVPPPNEFEMVRQEERYAKLKILCERKGSPDELAELRKNYRDSLENFFRVADDWVWQRLEKKSWKILAPENNTGLEALEPLTYAASTGDEKGDQTFLFKRGLVFRWTFELRQQPKDGLPGAMIDSMVVETLSPRVVHFSPKPGQLRIAVEVQRRDKTSRVEPVKPGPIFSQLAQSTTLGLLKNFNRSEWASLGLAAIFALVSGLLTFYYKNPVFGATQDYLALFLWGVGVDQTKNLLQHLQSTSEAAAGK